MEVSQGPAPSAVGRAARWGAPVPLDPRPKTPNHGFLQQREESLCHRHSFWEPLAAEEFGKVECAHGCVLPVAGGDRAACLARACGVSGALPALFPPWAMAQLEESALLRGKEVHA